MLCYWGAPIREGMSLWSLFAGPALVMAGYEPLFDSTLAWKYDPCSHPGFHFQLGVQYITWDFQKRAAYMALLSCRLAWVRRAHLRWAGRSEGRSGE
jgi:hypothetical protein